MSDDIVVSMIRMVLALIAGGIIGLERSYNGRPAGFRTHSLVCMSSSILMLLTVHQWELLADAPIETLRVDPTRMAQGIMTGIGFLGAGVIMKDTYTIRGLTTAASIWITASIGILLGMGYYDIAVGATILSLGTLSIFRMLESKLPSLQFGQLSVRILRKTRLSEDEILEIIQYHDVTAQNRSYFVQDEGKYMCYEMTIHTRHQPNFKKLAETLSQMEEILEFSVTPRSN
ncbi:MAG: MgtC/SapB family protein [Gammaproteobacteria bacterium]|nr:MgtC/SapB family protein [Gammaproteobacteria bacterium]